MNGSFQRRMHAGRKGFSLIELLAVLLLIAVATAMVTIRWSSIYGKAKLQSNIDRIIDADGKARLHAIGRNLPCRIEYDFEKQAIRTSRWQNGIERLKTSSLNPPTRLVDIRIPKFGNESERTSIGISKDGASVSYVVQLQLQDERRWILFAGLTGQPSVYFNEETYQKAFGQITGQRPDAN